MFDIVLYQPEIPPNTGNIIRLCANSGARLHLIKPLGFFLEDKQLRRAGLDYHEFASVRTHEDFAAFVAAVNPPRLFAFTTKATRSYAEAPFQPGDALLFGPESRGLPESLIEGLPPEQRLRVPMLPGSRSINLSNTVALVLYEAWRQNGFEGAL